MPPIRAAIYARVSSERQRDNTSIETQVADCRRYAETHGWTVADVYADVAVSGRREQRPQLDRLKADVAAKRVDAVIVWKLDRLARDLRLQLELIGQHFKAIQFASVTEVIDRDTAAGWVQAGLAGLMSEYFSRVHGERVKRARQHQKEQGRWASPAPYGYTTSGGVLTPNDDAPIVTLAFELYATGKYGRSKLADELNARGYRMRDRNTGEQYPFGNGSLAVILKNPAYLGLVSHRGTLYPGNHPALVDQALWDAVVAQRARHRNGGGVARNFPSGLLIGVGICAWCGSRLWNQMASSTMDGRSYAYHYYRCGGNHRRTCKAPMSRAEAIDPQVADIIASLAIPQDVLDAALADLAKPQPAPSAPDVDAIRAQMDRLTRVYVAGRMDEAEYETEYAILAAQLEVAPRPTILDYGAAAVMLRDIPALFAIASADDRRALVQELFASIAVAEGVVVRWELYPEIADIVAVVGREDTGLPDSTHSTTRTIRRAPSGRIRIEPS